MIKLIPKTEPKPQCSDGERIIGALNVGIADMKKAMETTGVTPRGVCILFLHEDKQEDGSTVISESWIIQGMNGLEAIGLMAMTTTDIAAGGVTGDIYVPHEIPDEPA